ncbi:MAG: L-aspartate oxidase [Kiritimatiellia bacterium]|jgi:L-aspartate oxidase|nr:L-aspartate oxidase [Kiritimatiellia bacterium]MDP6631597.1 L-aspartate oxidase [Kiritimatiellia bacterium]MDP6810196.1 L-aspartate oxidase [Kiritimatiellia bacterium]MDP7022898.1 L-aspartate oxidase [Kiritimatiellia bacterium]
MQILDYDYCVVGSGLAGLLSALHLAESGSVLVVTKKGGADSNTNYAQGGMASVVAAQDSFEAHVADTLEAGAGLCDEAVVRDIVAAGPQAVSELEALGLSFTHRDPEEGGGYDLGKEGGHSERRVLHAGDITGREIEAVLLDRVREAPNITLREQAMAIDLITTGWLEHRGVDTGDAGCEGSRCVGIYLLDRTTGEISAVRAPRVILASGGGGKVYLYTSNPDVATGDGVAMAWRAGLPIKNMEFIQFHPTCLFHPEAKSFLVSEAVRGEGARLVDENEQEFMQRYDERGALAPRDIVARAIDEEMKLTGAPCVYLDIRHQPRDFLQERFPNIFAACLGFGIDMSKDLIPVVPAAHYFCGGVEAQVNGETAMPGLYACGEVACTGLHGANRLASNSLLEAVVCAHRMADHLLATPAQEFEMPPIASWEYGDAVTSDEAIVVEHNWNEVRTGMWDYVGIVRTDKRLERAARRIGNLHHEIYQYYMDYLVTPDVLELRNIAAVAELIIRSAQLRRESRGLHSTLDCPGVGQERADTIIIDPPGGDTRLGG